MLEMNKIVWKRYYYRVMGFIAVGSGAGLILDELIHGPFTLTPANHEFWGIIAIIVGCVLISKAPHGKD